ncbi:MAG: hypothetical protein ACOY0T_06465 [Myxococcota bacterium]
MLRLFVHFVFGLTLASACVPRDGAKRESRTRQAPPATRAGNGREARSTPEHEVRAPLFRESVGLNVKFTQGQPLSDLPTLTELGVSWVRDTVDWASLEQTPGSFHKFPAEFLQRLDFYKAHDIGVVFLLGYQNELAYAATPSDPLRPIQPFAFGRYALAVARGLRDAGVRFVLEIWNEPHNFAIRPMVSGSWNGAPPAPWVDHYLKMVDEAVRQVKAFDPSIRLLSDDDMWIIHYWYLEQGLNKAIDGFAFHPYTLSWPERAAVDQSTDWVRPFTVVDADASFQSAVRRLRAQGKLKLGKTPEMWVTEWGWAIGQQSPLGPISEELLAAWLPRAYVSAAAVGVKAVCWFSARDSVDGPMGLMTNDGRRRRPFYALKNMVRELGHSALVKHVWGAEHLTSGLQGFLFRNSHDARLVVWNADSGSLRLRLTAELSGATVVDVIGQAVTPALDEAGVSYVTVSGAPIYLSALRPGVTNLDSASLVRRDGS